MRFALAKDRARTFILFPLDQYIMHQHLHERERERASRAHRDAAARARKAMQWQRLQERTTKDSCKRAQICACTCLLGAMHFSSLSCCFTIYNMYVHTFAQITGTALS